MSSTAASDQHKLSAEASRRKELWEALRYLKRRHSDVAYRQLLHDSAAAMEASPGEGTRGGFIVLRGRLTPRTLTLRTRHFPNSPSLTLQPGPEAHLDTERRCPGIIHQSNG